MRTFSIYNLICAQCFFYRCRLTTVCRLLNITFVEPNQKDTQCTKYGILHLALCTVYLITLQTHKSAICNTIRHLCNCAQKSSESGKKHINTKKGANMSVEIWGKNTVNANIPEESFVRVIVNGEMELHIERTDSGYSVLVLKRCTDDELADENHDFDDDFVDAIDIEDVQLIK